MSFSIFEPGSGYQYLTKETPVIRNPLSGDFHRSSEVRIENTVLTQYGKEVALRKRTIDKFTRGNGQEVTRKDGYCNFRAGEITTYIKLSDLSNITKLGFGVEEEYDFKVGNSSLPWSRNLISGDVYYVKPDRFLPDKPAMPDLRDDRIHHVTNAQGINIDLQVGENRLTILSTLPPFQDGFRFRQLMEWRFGSLGVEYQDRDWAVGDLIAARISFKIDEEKMDESEESERKPGITLTVPKFRVFKNPLGEEEVHDFEMTFPLAFDPNLREKLLGEGKEWMDLYREFPIQVKFKRARIDHGEDNFV